MSQSEINDNVEILDGCISPILDELFDAISRQQIMEHPSTPANLPLSDMKSFLLISLEWERVGRMEISMTLAEVRKIIESTLSCRKITPDMHDLAKNFGLGSRLKSCPSYNYIVTQLTTILEDNRSNLTKLYGLSESALDAGISKIKALNMAS